MDAPLAALPRGQLGVAELLTVPLEFAGARLALNIDAAGQGSAYVEIQTRGAHGWAPAEGFALGDALPVVANSVAAPVRWRRGRGRGVGYDVSSLAGVAVRLRFVLTGCKLYAFQFV